MDESFGGVSGRWRNASHSCGAGKLDLPMRTNRAWNFCARYLEITRPKSSQAAGYEVAALFLEAIASFVRNKVGGFKTFRPTNTATKSDHFVGERSALFGNELNGMLAHAFVLEIQVDAAAHDARVFARNDSDRSQESSCCGVGSYRYSNWLQTVGNHGDVDTREIFAT